LNDLEIHTQRTAVSMSALSLGATLVAGLGRHLMERVLECALAALLVLESVWPWGLMCTYRTNMGKD